MENLHRMNEVHQEKMAIAMHCNLRPPDVTLVVQGFNYPLPGPEYTSLQIQQFSNRILTESLVVFWAISDAYLSELSGATCCKFWEDIKANLTVLLYDL